jgi:hypothetical protein
MKPPSYLRQLAAPPRAAAGVAMLAPPRFLFRPSPPPSEFTVIEQRATGPQLPWRVAPRPGLPAPAASEPVPTMPGNPARASRSAPHRSREVEAPGAAPAPDRQPALARPRPPSQTRMTAAAGQIEAPRAATKPPARGPASQGAAPPRREPPRIERTALRSAPQPTALSIYPAPPTLRNRALPAYSAAPPLTAQPPRSAPVPPPVVVPLTPPTPPPRDPVTERTAAAVRIGTLEVRVVAPGAAPVLAAAVPTPGATPAAPDLRRADTSIARLARGFAVFGLGQA